MGGARLDLFRQSALPFSPSITHFLSMLPFLHLIVGSLVGAQSDGCGVRWAHAGKTFDTLVEVPVSATAAY